MWSTKEISNCSCRTNHFWVASRVASGKMDAQAKEIRIKLKLKEQNIRKMQINLPE